MKTEELLSIGLTEEQANKIFAMNGKDIEKHKKAAEDAKADKEALEQQVTDRDKDIAELKKASGDVAKIQEKLDELQGKYDKETEAYKAQLAQRDYQSAIDKAIADSGLQVCGKGFPRGYRRQQARNEGRRFGRVRQVPGKCKVRGSQRICKGWRSC